MIEDEMSAWRVIGRLQLYIQMHILGLGFEDNGHVFMQIIPKCLENTSKKMKMRSDLSNLNEGFCVPKE